MAGRWRVGRTVGRTIYLDDDLVGVMDTRDLAGQAVDALNAPALDRDGLVARFLQVFEDGGLWDGLEPEAYKVRHRTKWATAFADAVLSLGGEKP